MTPAADENRGAAVAITRFGLTTQDAGRLVAFYERAFGCRSAACTRADGAAFERLMTVRGGASRTLLDLGAACIELLEFDRPGARYPADWTAADVGFQHFALVVADMASAFGRLADTPGWSSITRGGPERLPARSGGVLAFKFRDPDGHPLELLEFPPSATPEVWRRGGDGVLGIDHSALSIADPHRSVSFYRSLGFEVTASTRNYGAEQAQLDDVTDPKVEVIALAPPEPTPHLELLGYRTLLQRSAAPAGRAAVKSNDVAATRLVIECSTVDDWVQDDPHVAETLIQDPDGHRLHLIPVRRPLQAGTAPHWCA